MTRFTGVIMETQSRFGGGYPEVAISPSVNYEELVADDPKPMFVVLPIGEVDTNSRNGRSYDREAVQSIVDTIVNEKSIGQKGHLRDEDRPYNFDIPPLVWVGATLEADGKAYGKAYVLQSAPEVREYIKVAKASKSKIGTSIYGLADIDEDGKVTNLQIESIDLAHPSRLGVEMAGAIPQITTETARQSDAQEDNPVPTNNQSSPDPGQDPPASPEDNRRQAIVEMERQHQTQLRELGGRIAELEGQLSTLTQIGQLLGAETEPVSAIQTLQEQVTGLQTENSALLEEAIAAAVRDQVAVPNAHPIIIEMVQHRQPTTRDAVLETVQTVLDTDAVKALLKDAVAETMGPNQKRPVNQSSAQDEEETQFYVFPDQEAK